MLWGKNILFLSLVIFFRLWWRRIFKESLMQRKKFLRTTSPRFSWCMLHLQLHQTMSWLFKSLMVALYLCSRVALYQEKRQPWKLPWVFWGKKMTASVVSWNQSRHVTEPLLYYAYKRNLNWWLKKVTRYLFY